MVALWVTVAGRGAQLIRSLKSKKFERWVGGYARHAAHHLVQSASPAALMKRRGEPRHVLFAICDHYEPMWGKADVATGEARVRAWHEGYPKLADRYRDADGRPPRHSFFFPGEEYRPQFLESLADLARRGYGEVEVHLHHDGDTAATLTAQLDQTLRDFAAHGHIARDHTGRMRYAFIHGNWSLANSRSDGRWCGVDEEIPLLWQHGCYADFTFPAAPHECQPNIVNQIYWPTGDLARRRAYEEGARARVGEVMTDRLLMIQGPLALAKRPGRLAVRIENAALTAADPGSAARARTWVRQAVHVEGRPDWVFVKLHTHGAPEREAASLLGSGGDALHTALTTQYNDGKNWVLHYVTAREMYNIAIAAMDGATGDPNAYRDHVFAPPPVMS